MEIYGREGTLADRKLSGDLPARKPAAIRECFRFLVANGHLTHSHPTLTMQALVLRSAEQMRG